MPKTAGTPAPIYQLKITLRGSKPPIWRRVLVPGSVTLSTLHQVIQAAMGWMNSHLHEFVIDGITYSAPSPYDYQPMRSERGVRLDAIAPVEKRKFRYEYDFGDSWEHDILVEKILAPDPAFTHPICTAGKRACPPEDVGGIWSYPTFLEALTNPEHEEHAAYRDWIGGSFDPEAFNVAVANQRLKTIK